MGHVAQHIPFSISAGMGSRQVGATHETALQSTGIRTGYARTCSRVWGCSFKVNEPLVIVLWFREMVMCLGAVLSGGPVAMLGEYGNWTNSRSLHFLHYLFVIEECRSLIVRVSVS